MVFYFGGGMAELADAGDLKSLGRKTVQVQVLFSPPFFCRRSLLDGRVPEF